ncbi:hypothetical protein RHGRI_032248 [Rhododendron griersonianum]|uniref:Uncharacterized protein n=1 Tax=Rhododendron griersonianum TaxID=479676 RepID=A0AAV6IB97_9ERIC|nr:hypothetical protein RHGRI_032248 [Rhododendron griersonianum]
MTNNTNTAGETSIPIAALSIADLKGLHDSVSLRKSSIMDLKIGLKHVRNTCSVAITTLLKYLENSYGNGATLSVKEFTSTAMRTRDLYLQKKVVDDALKNLLDQIEEEETKKTQRSLVRIVVVVNSSAESVASLPYEFSRYFKRVVSAVEQLFICGGEERDMAGDRDLSRSPPYRRRYSPSPVKHSRPFSPLNLSTILEASGFCGSVGGGEEHRLEEVRLPFFGGFGKSPVTGDPRRRSSSQRRPSPAIAHHRRSSGDPRLIPATLLVTYSVFCCYWISDFVLFRCSPSNSACVKSDFYSTLMRRSRSISPRRRRSPSPTPRRRKTRSPTPRRYRRHRSISTSLSPITKSCSPSTGSKEHKNAGEKVRKEDEEEEKKRRQQEAEMKLIEEETAKRVDEAIRKKVEESLDSEETKLEVRRRLEEGRNKLLDEVAAQLEKEKEAALIESKQKEAISFSPTPRTNGREKTCGRFCGFVQEQARKQKEELERMLEENRRKVEEAQRREALEQQRREEERYRELEELQRQKEEAMRRKKQQEEEERANQLKLLGKNKTRPKVSFAIGFK